MKPLTLDLDIYKKFGFEKQPIAIKFLLKKPEGIPQLDKTMALCEMLKEAQQRGTPFYAVRENENCFGAITLGMVDSPTFAESGQIGPELEIFQEARANSRIYQYLPKIKRGLVDYVVFSPLDRLNFNPDLLILTASISQAEIVLRAMSYFNGEIRESKTTGAFGCAWLYTYPYLSGEVNYTITGLAFGTKAKQVFPEGLILITIPYDWIPIIASNLHEMNWVPTSYTEGAEKFKERERKLMERLSKEYPEK